MINDFTYLVIAMTRGAFYKLCILKAAFFSLVLGGAKSPHDMEEITKQKRSASVLPQLLSG